MLTMSHDNAVRVLTGSTTVDRARNCLRTARAMGSDAIELPGRMIRVTYSGGVFTVHP
jgi:hypothetical protein